MQDQFLRVDQILCSQMSSRMERHRRSLFEAKNEKDEKILPLRLIIKMIILFFKFYFCSFKFFGDEFYNV